MTKERSPAAKLTPPKLAALWGVSRHKIVAWIRAGELRAIDAATRQGGQPRYLIDPADVEAFEERRRVSPPPKAARRKRPAMMEGVKEFF